MIYCRRFTEFSKMPRSGQRAAVTVENESWLTACVVKVFFSLRSVGEFWWRLEKRSLDERYAVAALLHPL